MIYYTPKACFEIEKNMYVSCVFMFPNSYKKIIFGGIFSIFGRTLVFRFCTCRILSKVSNRELTKVKINSTAHCDQYPDMILKITTKLIA